MNAIAIDHPREALRHCERITRERARNFYYGLKLLPEPQRSAMYAIYAWMRQADDLVDDTTDDAATKAARIAAFRTDTDRAIQGDPSSDDPIWVGLSFVANRFKIDRAAFHAMLDGQLDDVRERRYRTFDDLREYCYRVASTVGLVSIAVWGYDDAAAPSLAVDRGIAFQLTNILRDFREDYDAGRVYLPEEDFKRHGISPVELYQWSVPQVCEAMLTEQLARAESFYERSAPLDQMITPSCRPTLWAMTAIYRGLLDKMKSNPAQLVSAERVRLSPLAKTMIALRARWGARGA
ncbi:MAG TPA: phytoene/squalene synthase family protein [Phycisphaerales bacterium]|nr:phytoene/squalene synthase family protein [Phycisphaerales bacterium]HRQ76548.1 phytoene/squalene synthase family protein [Phycisphaerales bacterium]